MQQGCFWKEGKMINLKEYAKQNNISYEAVRKQVRRYQKELEGHIFKQDGKTQYLDEEAVAFLNDKRKSNPIIVQEVAKDEQIEELQNQNKMLLVKVAELQDQLLKKQDKIELLQADKIALLEEKKQESDQNDGLKEDMKNLVDTVKQLQEELEREKNKTFWQRLFKG